VSGLSALLFLPVDADGDGAGGARSRRDAVADLEVAGPKQRVSVFVNEKSVGTLDIADATRRYDVAVPAAVLHRATTACASPSGPPRTSPAAAGPPPR